MRQTSQDEYPQRKRICVDTLCASVVEACVGLFCVFRSGWFIAAFPALTQLYGVMALMCSFSKIQWAVDLLRRKHPYWFVALILTRGSLIKDTGYIVGVDADSVALYNNTSSVFLLSGEKKSNNR